MKEERELYFAKKLISQSDFFSKNGVECIDRIKAKEIFDLFDLKIKIVSNGINCWSNAIFEQNSACFSINAIILNKKNIKDTKTFCTVIKLKNAKEIGAQEVNNILLMHLFFEIIYKLMIKN